MQEISLHPSVLKNLKYILLPGNILSTDQNLLSLHNQVFAYWKEFWQSVFKQNQASSIVNPDMFYRQTIISLLLHGEKEVVSLLMHTFFNLQSNAALSNSYISENYSSSFLETIKKQSQKAMSVEYLTVNPDWTRKKIGISLAETMFNLGVKCMKMFDVDIAISIVRDDIKVNEMCHKLGYESIEKNIIKHNTSCDLMALHKNNIREHPENNISQLTHELWSKKIDRLNITTQNTNLKVA